MPRAGAALIRRSCSASWRTVCAGGKGWVFSCPRHCSRLALLGTAVGFILMLIPIAGLTSFDVETLRKALAGMSSGMAVALNITVTGIGTALLLKLQYYFLTRAWRIFTT